MPYFELKHGAETTRVYLGPMPFLIAENFNPKTGQEVAVKGYKLEDRIIAAQVTFVAGKRTVKFRDERGWPVWRGGFGGAPAETASHPLLLQIAPAQRISRDTCPWCAGPPGLRGTQRPAREVCRPVNATD